jgi:hypothetical protein
METAKLVAVAVLVTAGAFMGGMVSNIVMPNGGRECENCERAMKMVMQCAGQQAQPGQTDAPRPKTPRPARLTPASAERTPQAITKTRQLAQPTRRPMRAQPPTRTRPEANPMPAGPTRMHAVRLTPAMGPHGERAMMQGRDGGRGELGFEMRMRRMMMARGEAMEHQGRGRESDRDMMKKRAMMMRGDAGECPMMKRGGHEGGPDMLQHRGPGDGPMMMKRGQGPRGGETKSGWDKRDGQRGEKPSCAINRGGGRGCASRVMMKDRDGKSGCDKRGDKPGCHMKRGGEAWREMMNRGKGGCDKSRGCDKRGDMRNCDRSDKTGREIKRGGGHGDDACPMMKRGGHEGGSDMMRHRGPGDRPMMMKHGGSDKPGCQMKCESKPGGPDQHRWKRHRR